MFDARPVPRCIRRRDVRVTAPLVERGLELDLIDQALARAGEGSGGVTLLDAPSGAGKTALIAAARHRATAAGMTVLDACGSELESGYPFGTVVSLIDSWLAIAEPSQREGVLAGRARLAAPLFPASDAASADDGDEFAIIHGMYWWIANLCDVAPVAVTVDDVHLCDDPSLRFFNYLAARLDDLPIALFVAVRSGDSRASAPLVTHLTHLENKGVIRPPALSQEGVAQLLRWDEPGLSLSPEATRRCWMITGGNPFLVGELSATIRTEGREWLDANIDRLDSFAPPTVRTRVLQRLARLGDDALALARAHAVLRSSAPLPLAAEVAGIPLERAVPLLDLLEKAQIIVDGPRAHFRHPMIRSAVYEAIPASQLAATHSRAAAALRGRGENAELVARHLLMGLPATETWAVDVLADAATAAARKGSNDTAIRYLRHVVTLPLTDDRRADLLVELGLLEAGQADTAAGVEHLEQALTLMQDPAQQARCLYSLGTTLYRSGRHSDAAATFERSALLARHAAPDLALEAEGAWIFASYYLDQVVPRAMERLTELSANIDRDDVRSPAERVILAIAALRAVMSTPPVREGAAMAAAAVGDGALLQEETFASAAVNLAVLALAFSDRLDEASQLVDRVTAATHRRQHAPMSAEAAFIRSMVDYARGSLTDAWVNAQAAVDGVARGWRGLAPMAQGTLVQCLVERDDVDQAEVVLEQAVSTPLARDSEGLLSWIHMARGRVQSTRGDFYGALQSYLSAGRTLCMFDARSPGILRWRSSAGLAAKALGDEAMAAELIDEELSLAVAFDLPRVAGDALRAKTCLMDRASRVEALEEVLAVHERHGTPLDVAETLLELGRALRRSGSRLESRTPLKRAVELAHRQGALATARHAHDELIASGARPRRMYARGLYGLTPTELRIAEMVARGLTNREVGETMFLAKSTVAWHLRNIFQKLGIDSRADLPAAIAGTPTILRS